MLRRWLTALGTAAGLALMMTPSVRAQEEPKTVKTDKATVVVFRVTGEMSEKPAGDDLFGGQKSNLKELIERMRKAADDPKVKAVVLMLDDATIGAAQKEEVRQAISRMKSAGKDVYAHSDSMQMGNYSLLSGVNRLSVVPTGDLWVTGMAGEAMFIRGMLDWMGVQPDFLTCGPYKSAAEMFMRKEASPEAHAMQNWLMDSIYNTYLNMIATGRGVDVAKVKGWVDNGPYTAERAKAAGMIDAVEHRQDFEAFLRSKVGDSIAFDHKFGEKKPPSIDFNNPFAVFKLFGDAMAEGKKKKSNKPCVAIVYVEGAISVGNPEPNPLDMTGSGAYSTPIRRALDDALRDDSVKAVVLRVNSPGGSAVASEIILDATKRLKAKKPFVVSMGDVAGSGGYYVACGSDTIFADNATITGSIGVVSGKLVTNPAWAKIGVTFTPYQRGKNAGMLSSATPFNPEERAKMQAYMDEIYGVFKGHVVAIRGSRLKKPIDELAGGRVYTGQQALELGLVDKIGTMNDAVKFVAAQANLSEFDVRTIPEPKNPIEQIIEQLMGGSDNDPKRLDTNAQRFRVNGVSLMDLAAPQIKLLEPRRAKLVLTALQQLQTLQREGVCLMMPEYLMP